MQSPFIPEGQKRKYSTEKINLNPSYVTGFCDAESSFTTNIYKSSLYRTGWNVSLIFSIHLKARDVELLEYIKAFFLGVGSITINKDGSTSYLVNGIKDLTNVIIPHFDKYPLLTKKHADFELFRLLVELVSSKEHLTIEGFIRLLE